MSGVRRLEPYDEGEYTWYHTRNYATSEYKFENEMDRNFLKKGYEHVIKATSMFKQACLTEASREKDESMMSIERDTEYYPSFKECVVNKNKDYFNSQEK